MAAQTRRTVRKAYHWFHFKIFFILNRHHLTRHLQIFRAFIRGCARVCVSVADAHRVSSALSLAVVLPEFTTILRIRFSELLQCSFSRKAPTVRLSWPEKRQRMTANEIKKKQQIIKTTENQCY